MCQSEDSVSGGKLIGSFFKKDLEGLETFVVGDGGVKVLDVHGKDEVMGPRN